RPIAVADGAYANRYAERSPRFQPAAVVSKTARIAFASADGIGAVDIELTRLAHAAIISAAATNPNPRSALIYSPVRVSDWCPTGLSESIHRSAVSLRIQRQPHASLRPPHPSSKGPQSPTRAISHLRPSLAARHAPRCWCLDGGDNHRPT